MSSMAFQKGHTPWHKGKKLTAEQKSKMNMGGLKLGHQIGEKHHFWKGDRAGYVAIHNWIYKQLGKATECQICGSTKDCQWANISGEYHRDVNDFMSLCRSCHRYFDQPRYGSAQPFIRGVA